MRIIISILFLCLALAGCVRNSSNVEKENSKAEPTQVIPAFNADSAFSYVKMQVDFGPRVPGSSAHQKCGDYLVSAFKKYGITVIEQKASVEAYDGSQLPMRNIIARINPESTNRIFIAAHWDCRPWADHSSNPQFRKKPIDGANDGASGVGVLLEIARLLKDKKIRIGLDLILFDDEDYGTPEFRKDIEKEDSWCLGAQYWAQHPHVTGYYARYGILLDMVGGKNAVFCQEEYSKTVAHDVVDKVWNTAAKAGFSGSFSFDQGGRIIDDHLFINRIAHIPCIDIIQYDSGTDSGFNPVWHTENDNMKNIDPTTLKAVGQTLLEVIFGEK
ncbi:MAG: M28 family peptidase [Bacteroidia bacterium]|nr:M28 family peptidase [Bacteroidia bacterium]